MEKRKVAELIRYFESNQIACRKPEKGGEVYCCTKEKYLAARSQLEKCLNYSVNYKRVHRAPLRSLKHEDRKLDAPDCEESEMYLTDSQNSIEDIGKSSAHHDDSDERYFSATSLHDACASGENVIDVNCLNECVDKYSVHIPRLTLYDSNTSESGSDKDTNGSDNDFETHFISAMSSTCTMSDNCPECLDDLELNAAADENDYCGYIRTLFRDQRIDSDLGECPHLVRGMEAISSSLAEGADRFYESPSMESSSASDEDLFVQVYKSYNVDGDVDQIFAQLFEDTFQDKEDEFNRAVEFYASILS